MVFLVIHDQEPVRQALHTALAGRGLGPCLTASDPAQVRELHRTVGPAVSIIIASASQAASVAEWRQCVGPVRAAFLGEGDLAAWAVRLPGELLLPSEPLPIDALVSWIGAVAAQPDPAGVAPGGPVGPVASAVVVPAPADAPSAPVSSLLGDYELLEMVREGERTVTYRALQRSVQRVVVLERLRSGPAGDPAEVSAFRALVRAQAAVVHPQIAAVYEAQEQGGSLFFTREWIEGKNLSQLRTQRQRLPQETLLDLLLAAGEAVMWLDTHEIPRRPVTPGDVVLARDGLARIANLATGTATPFQDETAEIRGLFATAQEILDTARPAEAFLALAARLNDLSPRGLRTWAEVVPALAEARRRATEARPPHTRRLSAATQEEVNRRRWRQRRGLVAAALATAVAGGVTLRWLLPVGAPPPRPLNEMIRIPGGPFLYQTGEMRELPEFWIGKYEVTIAQYAAFLDELDRTPGNRHDHPRQPAAKTSHQPADWPALLAAARRGGRWRGQPVDLNCPVTGVDYWDAWAYAHWRGHRLPTEEEWEKAARSTDGRLYPWGRHPDAPRANTGADFAAGAGRGGQDGHAGWAPVDAFADTDRSPYGVVGMAGNVSEWTDSTMLDPEVLDRQVPVLRGGSYASRPMDLTQRLPAGSAEAADPATGFRTVADRGD